MNAQEISKRLQAILPDLRQEYGVRDLWLFGSYVRAEQTGSSDIDILVTFDNPHLSLIEFIQLEQHLSAVLGVKVDLVEREMLKPTVGRNILQEAVAL
ncbi:MAG: nucleotidyltransferase family protein [Anaerolineae bacterium]|nr:nucleotidyltransferase family protein [Anaerolineae bacterium]